VVPGNLIVRVFEISLRHTTLGGTPLQETDIYGPGGIRTRNPSKPATADPRLELRMNSPNYTKLA
jgi:hypothetical protein